VCLLLDNSLHSRLIRLPSLSSFEFVAVYLYRCGFNAVVVVIYMCGPCKQALFTDFNDLLERLATYSTPLIIVDDFNIHVNEALNSDAGKLSDILISHSLQQHVDSPTHRQWHTLDLFLTRDDIALS
jgi:hypothetical protein